MSFFLLLEGFLKVHMYACFSKCKVWINPDHGIPIFEKNSHKSFQSSVYFSREDFPKIPPARPMKGTTPIETYSGEGILRSNFPKNKAMLST